jgi:protein SCO1/2
MMCGHSTVLALGYFRPADGRDEPSRAFFHLARTALYTLTAIATFTTLMLAQTAAAQLSSHTPKELENAGLDEKLGEIIPAAIYFRNESGEDVRLGSYFDGDRPVLLNLVYHDCPMLCNLVVDGLVRTMSEMSWSPGREFEVVTVSFNAAEGPEMASAAKRHALDRLGKPEAARGWHFLTGPQASIDSLTAAVGFRYQWVEDQQEFAHPAALIFLSGEGKIARYLYGIDYKPGDVRAALVEASNGQVGSALDRVILYCFQYDADKNSYAPHALNLMKAGGLLTMMVLGSMLFLFWRRESQRSHETSVA